MAAKEKIVWQSQVRKGCAKDRGKGDAPEKKRHAQVGPRRQRGHREEPETSDRNRALRSTQEGRQGPAKKEFGIVYRHPTFLENGGKRKVSAY